MSVLENVQRKFIRNVSGLSSNSYEDRLKELGMLDLSTRRLYLDLVEVYKILHGFTNLNRVGIFEIIGDNQRRFTRLSECPLNIIVRRCNLDIRRNFFPNRVACQWNNLPTDLKMCTSLSIYKTNLKSHLMDMNLEMLDEDSRLT